MNILFLGYWSINDGLTSATVLPHVKILSEHPDVEKVFLCTIERAISHTEIHLQKVRHVPLYSNVYSNVFASKLSDFIRFPRTLVDLIKRERIDLLICRSSLAGALGYLVWKKVKIPYIVESFEPHANYMLDSQSWRWYDPRFLVQKYFERMQKLTAVFLLPVSINYSNKLLHDGIDSHKVITMPCCVSMQTFLFNQEKRDEYRALLKIGHNDIVGIYVGKFGDIYYDEEAFDLYKYAFDFFGSRFHIIILSTHSRDAILARASLKSIPHERMHIISVPHAEVSNYLSAADFAFSTIRPTPHRKYCSPVKNGEYWANGLAILTERGIGDDSDIIEKEGGGVILNMQTPVDSFTKLNLLLQRGRTTLQPQIELIALKYRRMEIVSESYKKMLTFLSKK